MAMQEALEPRRMMSTSYSSGALSVTLSAATSVVVYVNSGVVKVDETVGGITTTTSTGAGPSSVSSISMSGSGFADTIDLSAVTTGNGFTHASLGVPPNLLVTGGNGADLIYGSALADLLYGGDGNDTISGAAGDDTLGGGAGDDSLMGGDDSDVLEGGANNDYLDAGGGANTLQGNGGVDVVNVGSGTLTATSSQDLSSLTVASAAMYVMGAGTGTSKTQSVSLTGTAKVDVKDNALVIEYSGASPLSAVRTALTSGYNSGAWNGSGVFSSTAASTSEHGVGYAEASDVLALAGTSTASWCGQVVDATALLVRYSWHGDTWYGETTTAGKVDADDFDSVRESIIAYAALDSGTRPGYVSWTHGDFNYDGVIDELDVSGPRGMVRSYNKIDNDYFDGLGNTQTVNATGNSTTDLAALATALAAVSSGGGTIVINGAANLGSTGLVLNGYSNVRIKAGGGGGGFTLTGVPSPGYLLGGSEAVVMMVHCHRILITGVEIDGAALSVNGVAVIDSERVTLDDNEIHDTGITGIQATGNENNHYTNNDFDNIGGHCIFDGNHQSNAYYQLHGGLDERYVVIAGNEMRGGEMDGIVGVTVDAIIAGNDIDFGGGGFTGIKLSGVDDSRTSQGCVVVGNSVVGVGWQGFQSDATAGTDYMPSSTVMGNTFTECGQNGMLLINADGWVITDNVCTNNAYYGCQVIKSMNVTLKYNDFSNRNGSTRQDAGIEIRAYSTSTGSSDITIRDNTFVANQVQGVKIVTYTVTGAVNLIDDIDILDNTFDGNVSWWLYVDAEYNTSPAQITDVTQSGNMTTNNGNGNGIHSQP